MVHLGVIWGLSEDYLKFSGNLMEFLRFPHESGTLTQRGEVCGCLENPGFIHCQQHGFVILDSRPCVFSVWWFPGWTVGKVQFAYIISVMVVCSSNIHFSRRLHVTRLFSKTLLENDFRHLWTLLRLKSGWWFGTFFIFPYIGNHHPNWLSYFQRGWNHNWPFRTQCFCVGGKLEAP